jgi:hypothetical protein
MIQLKVNQDFFSRFATKNCYNEDILDNIEKSVEYKHLNYVSQFANFVYFLQYLYQRLDILHYWGVKQIDSSAFSNNIVNLGEDFSDMARVRILTFFKNNLHKLIDNEINDIPVVIPKPKFYIGDFYEKKDLQLGNNLDIFIETINYIYEKKRSINVAKEILFSYYSQHNYLDEAEEMLNLIKKFENNKNINNNFILESQNNVIVKEIMIGSENNNKNEGMVCDLPFTDELPEDLQSFFIQELGDFNNPFSDE